MSVESLAVAMHHSQTTNPTTKWVLAGIANHDGDGGAWPTIATLAKYALCSERTAQRAIAELVALGEVRVEAQAGGTREWRADKRPNLYRFLLRCPPNCDRSSNHRLHQVDTPEQPKATDHGVTPMTPREADGVTPMTQRGDTGDINGVTSPVERGDTAMSPKPSLEPSMELKDQKPSSTATAVDAEFDTFWAAYPRKVGKGQAVKAYRAARRKVDIEAIRSALRNSCQAWANSRRPLDRIPHAATWLNGEPWHDDPGAIAPAPAQVTTFKQQATRDMMAASMERARQREAENERLAI